MVSGSNRPDDVPAENWTRRMLRRSAHWLTGALTRMVVQGMCEKVLETIEDLFHIL